MTRLRLSARTVRRLREALLKDDEQERFAFLDAGESDGELLGSEIETVPDDAMARQSATACRPDPAVERDHVSAARERQLAPLLVHSHPFAEDPAFSGIDIEAMGKFREWLTGLFPDLSFGFAVFGTRGIEAVDRDGDRYASLPIEVVGDWKLDAPVPDAESRFAVDGETEVPDRYDRNVRALGENGQRRLQDATVGIVGVGGLGSQVAEQLARLGVDDFVLVDPDIVEESNLSRLVGAYDHHVGKPKVRAVQEHLWRTASSDIEVETQQQRVEECPDALDRCGVVVGCVDSVAARSYCNEYAVKHLTYYLDAGVRIDTTDDQVVAMAGYVQLVAPGSNACFDCLGRHDQHASRIERLSPDEREAERERGYIDDDALEPEPAVIHLNGLCASKSVSMLVNLVTGCSQPPDFVRYENLDHEMTALTTEPSDACPTCGNDGVLGVGRRSFGDVEIEPDEPMTEEASD